MSMKLFCLCQTVWFDRYYKIFIQYSVLYRFNYCFSHFLNKKNAFSYNECVFICIFSVLYSVVESVEFVSLIHFLTLHFICYMFYLQTQGVKEELNVLKFALKRSITLGCVSSNNLISQLYL